MTDIWVTRTRARAGLLAQISYAREHRRATVTPENNCPTNQMISPLVVKSQNRPQPPRNCLSLAT